VERTDTYTEKSCSGNGLHIFVESAVAPDGEKEAITFPDGSKLEVLGLGTS